MRKQTRPPAPDVLVRKGVEWTQQWLDLRQRNPTAGFQWYTADGKTCREWILPALEDMTQGHCAFCDAFPLDDQSMEPIEHFRPKSDALFHHLAFEWTNLYYACGRCQSSKGTRWIKGLIAPDEGGYQFADYFYFEATTGELKPNPGAAPELQKRAVETIQMFDLDHPKRQRRRKEALRNWHRASMRIIDEFAYRDFIEAGSVLPPS
jgi:uncharacterized protein (TIGR02646 family)